MLSSVGALSVAFLVWSIVVLVGTRRGSGHAGAAAPDVAKKRRDAWIVVVLSTLTLAATFVVGTVVVPTL
ncbi:hypothetical protein ABID81_001222 [Frigoribacterium sp. PvP054]|uniref:hypothetical protein n=1 Tax=Frigoribacterium sp. PvP054 TaxID=3156438 RepID=UPI003398026B